MSSISLAQVATASAFSVDMPRGGCRLTAWQDGSAYIHYGAMPRSVRVEPGTFDFDPLLSALLARSYPQEQGKTTAQPVGSLSSPTSQALLLIDDEALVNSLLQRAWKARIAPETPSEIEDYEWVSKACLLQ